MILNLRLEYLHFFKIRFITGFRELRFSVIWKSIEYTTQITPIDGNLHFDLQESSYHVSA